MSEPVLHFSIKNVPLRTKEAMTRMAQRRGQALGVWLAEMVEMVERVQKRDMVEPRLFDPPPAPEPEPASTAVAVMPAVGRLMLSPLELRQLVDLAETPQAKRLAGQVVTDYLKLARASVRAQVIPPTTA